MWRRGALPETEIRSLERASSDFTSARRALEWTTILSLWKSGPFWDSLKTGVKNHSRSLGEKKKKIHIYIYDQNTPQPTQSTYGQTTDLQFQTTFPPESSTYYLIWSSLRESPEHLCFERTSKALLWALRRAEGFWFLGMGIKWWQANSVFMHSACFFFCTLLYQVFSGKTIFIE